MRCFPLPCSLRLITWLEPQTSYSLHYCLFSNDRDRRRGEQPQGSTPRNRWRPAAISHKSCLEAAVSRSFSILVFSLFVTSCPIAFGLSAATEYQPIPCCVGGGGDRRGMDLVFCGRLQPQADCSNSCELPNNLLKYQMTQISWYHQHQGKTTMERIPQSES